MKSNKVKLFMNNILSAMRELEAQQIMHRDIKPENIILNNNSQDNNSLVKLVDFGLADFVHN